MSKKKYLFIKKKKIEAEEKISYWKSEVKRCKLENGCQKVGVGDLHCKIGVKNCYWRKFSKSEK